MIQPGPGRYVLLGESEPEPERLDPVRQAVSLQDEPKTAARGPATQSVSAGLDVPDRPGIETGSGRDLLLGQP